MHVRKESPTVTSLLDHNVQSSVEGHRDTISPTDTTTALAVCKAGTLSLALAFQTALFRLAASLKMVCSHSSGMVERILCPESNTECCCFFEETRRFRTLVASHQSTVK